MNFIINEIEQSAKNRIEKTLKSWNNKENVKLYLFPIGIVAEYITSDNEIKYRPFNIDGTITNHVVYSTFEKATLELMYKANTVLIDAAERVLKA